MGSDPSFDPDLLAKPITQTRYDALFGDEAGAPRFNRAVAGLYPTGSTFKPITAMAALQSGAVTAETVINDPGCIDDRHPRVLQRRRRGQRAGRAVARRSRSPRTSTSTAWARELTARRPGPAEVGAAAGPRAQDGHRPARRVRGPRPRPQWRERPQRARARVPHGQRRAGRAARLGHAPVVNVGDNVNLAVGQGDLQATPLQMAVAYATIANGGQGRAPPPRPADRGRPGPPDPADRARSRPQGQDRPPPTARRSSTACGWPPSGAARHLDRRVLRLAARPVPRLRQDRHRRAPAQGRPVLVRRLRARAETRPIVVAVTVEQGGFGAETAAPIARLILSQ